MSIESHAFTALVNIAAAFGARRPIWTGKESVAHCWIDRAEWLLKVARDGLDTKDAIAECDAYCGRV